MDNAISQEPGPAFEWQAHPARERPRAAAAAIAVIVLLAAIAQTAAGHWGWGVFAAAAMCLSLHRFFFASRFSLDNEGVRANYFMGGARLGWDELRRVEPGPYGVLLSPLHKRSWRDSARGVYLLYGQHRETVLERLRERWPALAAEGTTAP